MSREQKKLLKKAKKEANIQKQAKAKSEKALKVKAKAAAKVVESKKKTAAKVKTEKESKVKVKVVESKKKIVAKAENKKESKAKVQPVAKVVESEKKTVAKAKDEKEPKSKIATKAPKAKKDTQKNDFVLDAVPDVEKINEKELAITIEGLIEGAIKAKKNAPTIVINKIIKAFSKYDMPEEYNERIVDALFEHNIKVLPSKNSEGVNFDDKEQFLDFLNESSAKLIDVETTPKDKKNPRSPDSLSVMLKQVGKTKPLPHLELIELMKIYNTGDEEQKQWAKNKITFANLKLVTSRAARYKHSNVDLEDLIQEGIIGLDVAIERFDYKRGWQFSTFATNWIQQSITRALSQNSRQVRLPPNVLVSVSKFKAAEQKFVQENGFRPTLEQIVEYTKGSIEGLTAKRASELRKQGFETMSMDRNLGSDENSQCADYTADEDRDTPDERHYSVEMNEELYKVMDTHLTPDERDVLKMRKGMAPYDTEYKIDDVAIAKDISREKVRQLESKATRKLKRFLKPEKFNIN